MSASPSTLHISNTIQGEVVKVMGNDMSARVDLPREAASRTYLADWRRLELQLVRRQGAHLLDDVAPAVTAELCWQSNGARRRCQLASGLEWRCGRHSSSDVVLRYLPVGPENDERSTGLSKSQFVVGVSSGQLVLRHGGGASPTRVDGAWLEPSREIRLTPAGAQITAGLSGLELALETPHDAETDAGVVWADVAGMVGAQIDTEGPPAVRIRRVNNAPDLTYVWLRRWAAVGNSPHCAVCVPSLGAPISARLLFVAGRYFIQALEGSQVVHAGDHRLEPGAIYQLPEAVTLRIGDTPLTWTLGK